MNTTVISGRLVRNPGYNEVENEKGLHKIAKFVLAVRRNYSDEVSFIPVKAFAKKAEFARDYLINHYYVDLAEKGYYNRLISGNINQVVQVDSVACDFNSYPYKARTRKRAKEIENEA